MASPLSRRARGAALPVRAREVPRSADRSPSARRFLQGALDQIGVATVLTMVEMERRSCVLRLRRGRELACVFLSEGRVVRAWAEGDHALTGAEAVFQLLTWSDGEFELCHADPVVPDEIGMSISLLLMEAARRVDELRAAGGLPAGP